MHVARMDCKDEVDEEKLLEADDGILALRYRILSLYLSSSTSTSSVLRSPSELATIYPLNVVTPVASSSWHCKRREGDFAVTAAALLKSISVCSSSTQAHIRTLNESTASKTIACSSTGPAASRSIAGTRLQTVLGRLRAT